MIDNHASVMRQDDGGTAEDVADLIQLMSPESFNRWNTVAVANGLSVEDLIVGAIEAVMQADQDEPWVRRIIGEARVINAEAADSLIQRIYDQ